MKFIGTPISGVFTIELEPHSDERGMFARTWDPEEFREHGLSPNLAQCSISFNMHAGTLRGMHYQESPWAEAKMIRCTRGALYDVALDLRRDSPTYLKWFAIELTAENRRALYIPEGCAHGFQTLADNTEILYGMSVPYHSEADRGVRYDDPAFGITWPETEKQIMSDKDCSYPDWRI